MRTTLSLLRPVPTRDVTAILGAIFRQRKSYLYRGEVNFQNGSKISGCSHMQFFLAVENAEEIAYKIAVNIARVNGPLKRGVEETDPL